VGVQPAGSLAWAAEDGPAPLVEVLAGLYPTGKAHGRDAVAFHTREIRSQATCLTSGANAVSST